jgi:fatty acid desaturase
MEDRPPQRPSPAPRVSLWRRWEVPTLLVAAAIHGCWIVLLALHAVIPWPLLVACGGYVLAWHSSLQHEAVHCLRRLPAWARLAIVGIPIGGWLPYVLYRRSHSLHHRDDRLTYPGLDTESFYHSPSRWAGYSPIWRGILMVNQTLLGRLLIGPALVLYGLVRDEARRALAGDFCHVGAWLRFAAALGLVLGVARIVFGMPIWEYYLLFVYPGISLGLLRSFIEHRWGETPESRAAVVESNAVFGLLFLWNNLHIVHHIDPNMPWFELPGYYRRHRAALLARNGGYVFRGYGEIAARWLFRPVFTPIHPG